MDAHPRFSVPILPTTYNITVVDFVLLGLFARPPRRTVAQHATEMKAE